MITITTTTTDKASGESLTTALDFRNQTAVMKHLKKQAKYKRDTAGGTKKDPIVTYTTSIIISES